MVTSHQAVSSPAKPRWFEVKDGPLRIRGRMAGDEPWVVMWMGRADAGELADFMFSMPLESKVKATAWKQDCMLEVDEVESRADLVMQLQKADESLDDGAYFIRLETPSGDEFLADAAVVVWSRQGPITIEESSTNNADGVGVYIRENRFPHIHNLLPEFVQRTFERVTGTRPRAEVVAFLLQSLMNDMTIA